jgi:hypothetical protein
MTLTTQPLGYRRVEAVLATLLVLFKFNALRVGWGRPRGYDWWPWTSAFSVTHWFEPLPSPRALLSSYHPPLSYLLVRWVFWFYPHEVQASQIVSTLAVIGAMLALRSALRRTGELWTLPGLWLLYGGSSLPFVVWFGTETGPYDPLNLCWFMLALSLCVGLFWRPFDGWLGWCDAGKVIRVTGLGLVLACGLLNKFSGVVACGLPFLVILARRGARSLLRELLAPLVAVAIAIIVVAPLYYHRYYQPEGQFFPTSVDWQLATDLARAVADRQAHPLQLIARMLRIPDEPIVGSTSAVSDSLLHVVWHQVWRAEVPLGTQSPLSSAVSDLYVRCFTFATLLGIGWFFWRRRQVPRPWHQWGWILLGASLAYSLSALSFAWKYPMFGLGLFKAKYMSPALFSVPYAALLPLSGRSLRSARAHWHALAVMGALAALFWFVCLNHLLPVY